LIHIDAHVRVLCLCYVLRPAGPATARELTNASTIATVTTAFDAQAAVPELIGENRHASVKCTYPHQTSHVKRKLRAGGIWVQPMVSKTRTLTWQVFNRGSTITFTPV